MDKLFGSNMSIERLAAYLDGNLSADEMQEVSAIVENDNMLKHIVDVSYTVDDTISSYTNNDILLPLELQMFDFEIPMLYTEVSQDNDQTDDFAFIQDSSFEAQEMLDAIEISDEIKNEVIDEFEHFDEMMQDSIMNDETDNYNIEDDELF